MRMLHWETLHSETVHPGSTPLRTLMVMLAAILAPLSIMLPIDAALAQRIAAKRVELRQLDADRDRDVRNPRLAAGETRRSRRSAPREPVHTAAAARVRLPQIAVVPPEPMVAVISLASQRISVHSGSGPIMESGISSGQAGYRTPTGVFSVLQRNRHHESNIYSGAPMPFMQRLTWSGIALHEGVVPGYPASHGCIRLPAAFASQLWSTARIGMRVVVAPSDVRPQSIAHPRLPVPRMTPVALNDMPVPLHMAALAAEGASERLLDPFLLAQTRKVKAAADRDAAERAVKPALEAATARSAEASRAAEQLKAITVALERAGEELDDKRETLVRNQTTEDDDDIVRAVGAAAAKVAGLQAELEAATAEERRLSDAAFAAARQSRETEFAVVEANEAQKLANIGVEPISIFVSLKEGRVFLRQGFNPIHDEPISVVEPNRPFGTHVYTAVAALDGGAALRWVAVSVPNGGGDGARSDGERGRRRADQEDRVSHAASDAVSVLDRFEFPEVTLGLIQERLWPGASLIVSDHGLGTETGAGTDFIVLTK